MEGPRALQLRLKRGSCAAGACNSNEKKKEARRRTAEERRLLFRPKQSAFAPSVFARGFTFFFRSSRLATFLSHRIALGPGTSTVSFPFLPPRSDEPRRILALDLVRERVAGRARAAASAKIFPLKLIRSWNEKKKKKTQNNNRARAFNFSPPSNSGAPSLFLFFFFFA